MEICKTATHEQTSQIKYREIPLSSIFQDLGLVVHLEGKSHKILITKDFEIKYGPLHDLISGCNNYYALIESLAARDRALSDELQSNYKKITSDKSLVNSIKECPVLPEDDFIIDLDASNISNCYTGFESNESHQADLLKRHDLQPWITESKPSIYSPWRNRAYPTLAISPKKEVSRMYLSDYLRRFSESNELREYIISNWENWRSAANRKKILMPSNRIQQFSESVERRSVVLSLKWDMARTYNQNIFQKDYLSHMRNLKDIVQRISPEDIEVTDILLAHLKPLPVFIEVHYDRYKKETEPLETVKKAKKLFNSLIKATFYLLLEEAMQTEGDHTPLCNDIVKQIRSRPLSDGSFIELFNQFERSGIKLEMFEKLLSVRRDMQQQLSELVNARNILHHNNDEKLFLKLIREYVPSMLRELRGALEGVEILEPQNIYNDKGQLNLKAYRAMGNSTDLESRDYPINKESAPSIISAKLIAFRPDRKDHVVLNNFFASKEFTSQRRDFGIFEKMIGSEPEFFFTHQE